MHVIITAGGTTVPIDDVRAITNGSKGHFPWQIACAFAERGWTVTVVGSERLAERVSAQPLPANITLRPYTTYDDLVRELDLAIAEHHPDALLMAAAVSDYGPDTTVSGKISSEQDKLVIRLRRLPKILANLRQHLGSTTCLVGFKLTSGSASDELLAAARKQLLECRCSLVVANDKSQLHGGQHPVTAVTAEGGAIPIIGARADVARQVTDFIIRRSTTTWSRSTVAGTGDEGLTDDPDYDAATKLLRLAQDTGSFDGSSGNVSVRTTTGLWTTPRGWPNKDIMTDQYLIRVNATDLSALRYVTRLPSFKPSIDTGVHGTLYAAIPDIGLLIHTHSPWVLTDRVTTFPYPCGTQEEAREILMSLKFDLDQPPDRFAITLIHHGALIGRPKDELDQLIAEWHAVRDEYLQHLEEVQQLARGQEVTLFPIWGETVPIGIAARHIEGWYALHLSPQFRGQGWGAKLRQVLINRRYSVGTIDACHVAKYYRDHGFVQTATRPDGTMIFTPPLESEVAV